jgi:hypothetical protein
MKAIFFIARRTVSAVWGDTPWWSFKTRETVEAETPAAAATFIKDIGELLLHAGPGSALQHSMAI